MKNFKRILLAVVAVLQQSSYGAYGAKNNRTYVSSIKAEVKEIANKVLQVQV